MQPLLQALRSLDPHTFELLVTQLLKARYPDLQIVHVDGRAGDQGLDIISGQLDEQSTVWQCKYFIDGIRDAQKQKIKDSLNQALKHVTPKRWILCVPTDLDSKALRWFQRLTASRTAETEIGLYAGSEIVGELLYRDTIREQFFPQVVLNTAVIRESLAGTKAFTTTELAALNEQNVDSYIARLQAYDARFTFAITFTRDRPPTPTTTPGTLLTVTTDQTILQVSARSGSFEAEPGDGQVQLQRSRS